MTESERVFHPAANIFPMMAGEEFERLVEDIRANGQREPIWLHPDGTILDGRNRYRACTRLGIEPLLKKWNGDGSAVSFVVSLNLNRRHLNESQRAIVGAKMKPMFEDEAKAREKLSNASKANLPDSDKGQARDKAAKAVNVSGRSIESASKVLRNATHELVEAAEQGRIAVSAAAKLVERPREQQKRAVQMLERSEARDGRDVIRKLNEEQSKAALLKAQRGLAAEKKASIESVCDLRVMSCRELFATGIRPDAVITDPPYPREFLPVFSELAECCASAAVPTVAVMSGHSYLPEVISRLCERLTYRWMLAYLTPGGQAAQQWQVKVNSSWKPVLLFGSAVDWFGDVAVSKPNDNDKRFHQWGQSESGMADLITRLTKPGQLICDPFLGGGTTAVAALEAGRRFVGCDIDQKCVNMARIRVEANGCTK